MSEKYSPMGSFCMQMFPSDHQRGMGLSKELDPFKLKGANSDNVTYPYVEMSEGENYPNR